MAYNTGSGPYMPGGLMGGGYGAFGKPFKNPLVNTPAAGTQSLNPPSVKPNYQISYGNKPLVAGMTQDPQPNYQISYNNDLPKTGMTYEPAPQDKISYVGKPLVTGMTQEPLPGPQDIQYTPQNLVTGMTQDPPVGGSNAPGPDNGFKTQYATMENIQPYMNPYLDQIIKNGTNAIEHSAAGQGLFGSTGNVNDIGTWAADKTYQAQNDAFGKFAQDRGYMTDQYWNTLQNDQDQSWKNYDANWNQYKYGNDDYLSRMMNSYNRAQDQVKAGQNATNTYSDSSNALAQAIAMMFGGMGNVGSQGVSNQNDIISGFIDDLMKAYGSNSGGAK